MVDIKYGSMWGRWYSNSVQGSYRVCLWKSIRKGCDTFYQFVSFKVGDGSSVMLWHDPWCGGLPLKDNFLELMVLLIIRVLQ